MAQPKKAAPASRSRSRGEKRKQEIARRICAAAEARVAEGTPFASISIEQLVADASVPRSTFYVHFSDKAAVIRTVLDELGDFSLETMLPATRPRREPITRDELRAVLLKGVTFYQARQSTFRMLSDASVSDAQTAATYRASVDRVVSALSNAIAARSVTRRPLVVHRTLASSLVWMLERTLYYELRTRSPIEAARLASAFESIIWNAVVGGS